MAGAEAESGVAALRPAAIFAAADGDAVSPRTTVPTAIAADPTQDEEMATAAPVPAPTPPPPSAAAASPIEQSLNHLRSAGTLDSLELRADPDAQATVTDFLDFTEHLPADVTRSLTLIGKLDRTHAEGSSRVHELTTLWGQLPTVPPEERPSAVQLRADISRHLSRGVRSRLYAAAESMRMNHNVTRHHHRSRAIFEKLLEMLENYPSAEEQQQQQQMQQRSPATAAKSPRAARPPRLALRVGEGGVGGERVRTRRVPRIMVPGEVLAPWELDFDSLSDDDDDDRDTDTDRENEDRDSQAGSDRDIKTPISQPRMIKVVKQSQQPKKKKKDGGRRAGSGSQRARQGPKSGLSASQALVKLMMNPPPENAVPGSSDAPWLQLTPWELARLRKRMKKNAEWNPSETMIARELKNLGRGVEAYREARRLAEEEGRTFPSVTQTLDSDGTGTIRESMDTNDLLMSNRGMRLNEAKKIKREAMAKQAAEEAEESARKMQELGQMMMGGGAAAPSALVGGTGGGSGAGAGAAGTDPPKEALPKPRSKSKSNGKRKRDPEEATDNANEPDRSVAARPDVKRTRTETPVPPPNLSFGGGGGSSSANTAAVAGTSAGVGGGPHGHTETPVLPPQVPLPQVPLPQVPLLQVPVPPTAPPAPAPAPPGPVSAAISNTRVSVRMLPGSPQQECLAPVPAAPEPALEPTAFAALAASTAPTAPPAPAPSSIKPASSSPSPSPAPVPAPAPPTMLATTTVTTTTTVPTKPPAETPIPPPVVPPPPPPPTRRETRGEAAKKSQQQQQQGQGQGQSRMSPNLASPSLPVPSSLPPPPPPQAASSRVTTPRTTPGPESAPNPPATAPTPNRRPPSRGKAGASQDPAQTTLASDRTRRASTTRNTPAPAEPPVREQPARRGRKPAPGVVGKTTAGGASRAVVKRKAAPRRKKKDRGAQQMMESELEEVDDDGNPIDPDEPRYCFCNSVSYGTMIYCEGNCSCEWFHVECVGLKENETPDDSWYCPDCRAKGLDQSDDDSSSESRR